MILLRPTINLYYDKIIDGTPIPNGAFSYDFTDDFKRTPFVKGTHLPILRYTALYNSMKALGLSINLHSGKDQEKNLYYPIELNNGLNWDIPFNDFIPKKTLGKIAKGKMKLLIFAPWLSLGYRYLWKLRSRLDELTGHGLKRDQIYIVLGDINESYRKLFDNKNVFGIDWWQIHTQIAYKSRYKMEDWYWVFRDSHSLPILQKQFEAENFDINNWNPKYIYTAFCGSTRLHDTTLISEIIYRNLDNCGIFSYNLNEELVKHNYTDFRIVDKTKGEEHVEGKKKIIEKLHTTIKKIDFNINQIKETPLAVDKSVYENSLINIVSESYVPPFDKHYLDETNAIAPRSGVWRQIAKGHPFMVLGCVNTMGHVTNEGYFAPTELVNGFYDKISSTTKRVELICDNIEKLASYSKQELQSKIDNTAPFMAKNKEKFYNKKNERKFQQLFREMMYE